MIVDVGIKNFLLNTNYYTLVGESVVLRGVIKGYGYPIHDDISNMKSGYHNMIRNWLKLYFKND